MCGVCVCWSILDGLSGMLVGNRLEVIMVHNLPIIVLFKLIRHIWRGFYSLQREKETEGKEGERERERRGEGEGEGGRVEKGKVWREV